MHPDIKHRDDVSQLGDLLGDMVGRFGERHELTVKLEQAWSEILPAGLSEHCRLDEVSAGVLKVNVDGPGYMHEIRMCKRQLCDALNKAVPGLKIRDIKTNIGN
ncbi:MAG: DUF721 domain-containing protein [Phycisphaerae bacterium]|jgi:hypothetical protein